MPRHERSESPNGIRHMAVYRLCDRVMVASYTSPSAERDAHTINQTIGKVIEATSAHGAQRPRLTVTDEAHGCIHYETSRHAMFVAVSSPEYPQRTAFRAIGEMRQQFEGSMGDAMHKAEEGGLSKGARPLMSEVCGRFADASSVDKTLGVIRQVDEVRGIVGESIQALLATNENLEVLEDRADTLRSQASQFQKTARAVRVVQQKQNNRMSRMFCVGFCVLIVVVCTPLIIYYREDIMQFLDELLPPCDRWFLRNETYIETECDVGSGEAASGEEGGLDGGGMPAAPPPMPLPPMNNASSGA